MEVVSYASFYDSEISYNHKCIKNIRTRLTNPQMHNAIEFIYLNKGSISYTVDEKSFKVESDSLIVTFPGKVHTITFNNLDIYDRFDLLIDEGKVYNMIYEKLKKVPDVISCKNSPRLYELFKRIDFYCKCFEGEELKNLLNHLVDEVAYNVVLSLENAVEEENVNEVLSKVIEYIEDNFNSQLTLKKICNDLYVSASYLHNLFKEHLNMTPKKYIEYKRLTFAQSLLKEGRSATAVYEKCGFSDYSVFYRSYKKHFGYSPSEEKNINAVREIIY